MSTSQTMESFLHRCLPLDSVGKPVVEEIAETMFRCLVLTPLEVRAP